MYYVDGTSVQTGDVIRMGREIGTVICDIEARVCLPPHDIVEWQYLGRGILVDFESLGIIHMETADSDIELVRRAK
jgi:hypothetical protein